MRPFLRTTRSLLPGGAALLRPIPVQDIQRMEFLSASVEWPRQLPLLVRLRRVAADLVGAPSPV
ncbi:MAG: hypothetical protein ACYC3Q_03945 [Gemmatimonadaceae bacterium]